MITESDDMLRFKNHIGGTSDITLTGFYFLSPKFTLGNKLVLLLDWLWFSFVYFTIAICVSAFLDRFTVRTLNKSESRIQVSFEVTAAAITNIFFLLLIVIITPKIVPEIFPNPPIEHLIFRAFTGGVLVSFGILAAEKKLGDKIRYVFNPDE